MLKNVVKAINAKGGVHKLSRRDIDALTKYVSIYGAKGLAFTRMTADATSSSFEKFLTEDQIAAVRTKAEAEKGDVILVVASEENSVVYAALGALRLAIAKKYELFDPDQFNFLWVTDFPLFEYDKEDITNSINEISKILVDDDDNILIANYHNMILLPGGKVQFGENSLDAITRELKEELNNLDMMYLMENSKLEYIS